MHVSTEVSSESKAPTARLPGHPCYILQCVSMTTPGV